MYCQKCGNEIDEKAVACPHCGNVLAPSKKPMSSGIVILLLFLFFPVGLYLMWAKTNWSKVAKIIVTVVIALVAVASLAESETDTPQKDPITPSASQSQKETIGNQEKETTGSTMAVDPYADAIVITADDLFAAYDTNEVAADKQYKGKVLKITGTIQDIGKDILDDTYITLDTGDFIYSIQCYFKNNQLDAVAALAKDQEVTLIGTCNGQTLNVVIKNCVIIE